jgi:hypothetical protein
MKLTLTETELIGFRPALYLKSACGHILAIDCSDRESF